MLYCVERLNLKVVGEGRGFLDIQMLSFPGSGYVMLDNCMQIEKMLLLWWGILLVNSWVIKRKFGFCIFLNVDRKTDSPVYYMDK